MNLVSKGKRLCRYLKKELEGKKYVVYIPIETRFKKGILGFDGICFREDGATFFEVSVKSKKSPRTKRIKDNPFYQRFKNIYRFQLWLWNPKSKKFEVEKL